jgi:hypothetical protein
MVLAALNCFFGSTRRTLGPACDQRRSNVKPLRHLPTTQWLEDVGEFCAKKSPPARESRRANFNARSSSSPTMRADFVSLFDICDGQMNSRSQFGGAAARPSDFF